MKKKYLFLSLLGFFYAPKVEIHGLSGHEITLPNQLEECIFGHIHDGMQLEVDKPLPQSLTKILHEAGVLKTFNIINYDSDGQILTLQAVCPKLKIEKSDTQETYQSFLFSRLGLETSLEFVYVPDYDDETEEYGFILFHRIKSPINPECNIINFHYLSNSKDTEYCDHMNIEKMEELFMSLGDMTLMIDIDYKIYISSETKSIPCNTTKPDHFKDLITTIATITSELKKIADNLTSPTYISPSPLEILEQLSKALDMVPHSAMQIRINPKSPH